MYTPLSWLERVPTYKDQQEQLREKDLSTYGFLGYPLLQSADILLYQPEFVPVGQDQVAHVELTREVARKFNALYSPRKLVLGANGVGTEEPDPSRLILPEPQVLLTPSPKLPGIDGRKMSKSYGNSILLSEWFGNVEEKMSRMSNGGQRNPQTQPGDPDICPVGDMHQVFSSEATQALIRNGCRTATIGCMECKMMAAGSINLHLSGIRDRREQLEAQPERVWDVLEQGAKRASERAEETMRAVREVTGLSRTRRPVPADQGRSVQGLAYDAPHECSEQREWWEIGREFRERNLVDHWRRSIIPIEVKLKADSDRVFTTRSGKRALVVAAREEPAEEWEFRARVRSCELMVLLCWDHDFQLHDFIVPQSVYVAAWTAQKKLYKKEELIFHVQLRAGQFSLVLPGQSSDITSYRGQYGPMK
jgi:tryptophanyl-tRNA synthetase